MSDERRRRVDHRNVISTTTASLIAEKGVWWSLQPFTDDDAKSPFPEGSPNRIKQLQMFADYLRAGKEVPHAIKAATKLLTGDDSDADIKAWYSEQWGGTLD